MHRFCMRRWRVPGCSDDVPESWYLCPKILKFEGARLLRTGCMGEEQGAMIRVGSWYGVQDVLREG